MERALEDPDVWADQARAQELGKEQASLQTALTALDRVSQALEEAGELQLLAQEEGDDDTLRVVADELGSTRREIERLEFQRMFSGKMDAHHAYLDIQAGSGGTEARTGPRSS